MRSSYPQKKSEIRELFSKGFDAALLVSFFSDTNVSVDWRLYDTDGATMVEGRKLSGMSLADFAANIAIRVVETLVRQVPPFLTSIAFVERKDREAGSRVWVTDFQGLSHMMLYDSNRILVCPSWGKHTKRPFIAISEFTPHNVRFIGLDMHGRRYKLLDREGTSVGLCYDTQTDRVIYAHSGSIWRLQLNTDTNMWEHQCIEKITGTCGTPVIGPQGIIFYCSNGTICQYDARIDQATPLTGAGFHVAPTYSAARNILVFASKDGDSMQLHMLALADHSVKRLTAGAGIKTDPSLSPCGRYCAYCLQKGRSSVIRILDLDTGQDWQISKPGMYVQFPSWSGYLPSTDIVVSV
jgi:hypothetical protein